MKFCIILAFVFFSMTVLGETTFNDLELSSNNQWVFKTNKKPYTGEVIEKYENGKIKGKSYFKNGLINGLRIRYYKNGNKLDEMTYKNAVLEGSGVEYYESGKKKQVMSFKNGKKNGLWKIFHSDGKKRAEASFDMDIQKGFYKEFAQDGKLLKQMFFVNGKPTYQKRVMDLQKKMLKDLRAGKCDSSIKISSKIIELNPTIPDAYYNRGVCHSKIFKYKLAIEDYNNAIMLNSQYAKAYANRGTAKINLVDLKKRNKQNLKSACDDLVKANLLDDKSKDTTDLANLYCQ